MLSPRRGSPPRQRLLTLTGRASFRRRRVYSQDLGIEGAITVKARDFQ